jgi:DNA repair exonuclease SbcCD ATPase subunit
LLDERDQARRELATVRNELSLVQECTRTERERADQQAAELARQQMAWRELAAEFDLFRAAADSANQQATALAEQHTQTMLAERESRQQAERELMAARSQHQKASDDAQALLAAREQLTTLGRELAEARSAVAAAAAERQALTARHEQIHERLMAELAKALEQLARAQSAARNENHAEHQEYLTRIVQLEGERDALAAELDAVIGRAADAVESAARDRRQAAEERGAWESEINTLRQALAGHAAPAANGRAIVGRRLPIGGAPMTKPAPVPVARSGTAAAKGAASPSASDPSVDPLLDSVMAQFALLKKNAVRPPAARQKVNP